ncbi:hypothetical protein CBS101457_002961 [Exobasidium rhododendri]|nr:hypothetical protein CBS101457_002961 [Exobasidium rhododendri]
MSFRCESNNVTLIGSCCTQPYNSTSDPSADYFSCNFPDEQGISSCRINVTAFAGSNAGIRCIMPAANANSSRRTKPNSKLHWATYLLATVLLFMLVNVAGAVNNMAAISPDGRCGCSTCDPSKLLVAMTVGYYSDITCQSHLKTVQYAAFSDSPPGCASCSAAKLPSLPTVYAKILSDNGKVQTVFSCDQVCPPGKINSPLATLDAGNGACVQLMALKGNEGVAVYNAGGSPDPRLSLKVAKSLSARSEKEKITCKGFKIDSQVNTYTAGIVVSPTVNCQNSATPCIISKSDQHTTSVTTSYSVTAGDDVFGIKAEATFGQDYTDSEATTIQESVSVPINQEGYLAVYSAATFFTGTYIGCKGGDQAGTALVPKKNGVIYQLVLTNE